VKRLKANSRKRGDSSILQHNQADDSSTSRIAVTIFSNLPRGKNFVLKDICYLFVERVKTQSIPVHARSSGEMDMQAMKSSTSTFHD
jgi:hypothetical protein